MSAIINLASPYQELLAVLAACFALITWHLLENRSLRTKLALDSMPALAAQRVKRFVWVRSVEMLAIAIGLLIVIIVYHEKNLRLQYNALDMRETIQLNNQALITDENALAECNVQLETLTQQANAASAAVTAEPAQPGNGISDVFGITNSGNDNQKSFDALKQKYETLYVNYFFLRKCQQAQAQDYHIINSALAQDMASVNAPGRLQYDIQLAARGTYDEIYQSTDCTQNGTAELAEGFRRYVSGITSQNQ